MADKFFEDMAEGVADDALDGCGKTLLLFIVGGVLIGAAILALVLWACGVF